jgi:hypothetical protein
LSLSAKNFIKERKPGSRNVNRVCLLIQSRSLCRLAAESGGQLEELQDKLNCYHISGNGPGSAIHPRCLQAR